MPHSPSDITQLLLDWSEGDREALDQLLPLVYEELRRLAHHYIGLERPGQTLQTTALVHEAYLRLVDQSRVRLENRAQFFGLSARLMRRILVDHARARRAAKRGGASPRLSLEEAAGVSGDAVSEMLALDEALNTLEAVDPEKSRIVEMRFFGGMEVEEVAEVLGVSASTVARQWRTARAWLYREMERGMVA